MNELGKRGRESSKFLAKIENNKWKGLPSQAIGTYKPMGARKINLPGLYGRTSMGQRKGDIEYGVNCYGEVGVYHDTVFLGGKATFLLLKKKKLIVAHKTARNTIKVYQKHKNRDQRSMIRIRLGFCLRRL